MEGNEVAVIKGIELPKRREGKMVLHRRHYSEEIRQEAINRVEAGKQIREVSREMNIPWQTIGTWVADAKKTKGEKAKAVQSEIAKTSAKLEAKVGEKRPQTQPSTARHPAVPKEKMTYFITHDEEFIRFGSKDMAAVGIASLIESGFQPSGINLYEAKKLEFQAEIKATVTIG
jgi:transposase-like protein